MKEILSQIRLLYVEDDESIRAVLSRGLKRRVKDIEVAIDGEDGLEKYLSFKPDIIVTDIKMPKMSGLEMSSKIREIDSTIPIIITSAHSESDTLLQAIEIGINGYVLKPIDKDKLFQTIYNYAKVRVLEKEIKLKDKQLIVQATELALADLIKNISHQWRQPLSVITTLASIINMKNDMDELDSDFMKDSLSQIIETSENLSNSIEFFYNATSKVESRKSSFNILDTINNLLLKLKSKLVEHNIEVILDIKDFEINSVENIINISI
ncbi:MAG: response regulator [Campylobacterota bacterium]|nr:response regulator [Campylobacterota bacterium]